MGRARREGKGVWFLKGEGEVREMVVLRMETGENGTMIVSVG